MHLAELSNDPLGELNERTTYEINHLGSITLARACKEACVPRFVYTSSCSVYGAAEDGGERSKESAPNPQTAYARCKVLVERDVGALADTGFSPVFLRNATAFGASPRMRFYRQDPSSSARVPVSLGRQSSARVSCARSSSGWE